MNPGAMRERITIYARGDSQDTEGFFASEPKALFTLRARRSYASVRDAEGWEGDAVKARMLINFDIRPQAGLCPGQWLVCEGQWHEILAVQQPTYLGGAMRLRTALKEAI